MIHLIPIIISFSITIIIIKLCYNFALSIDLVDNPDERKNHKGKIPLIGGIAILLGFSISCLISPRSLAEWRPLFVCLIPLAVVGVLDDHGDISVGKRVAVQIGSCLVMIYHGDVRINHLGDLLGIGMNITFSGVETVVTVFCVVGGYQFRKNNRNKVVQMALIPKADAD
ncbi:hypothetical protein OAG73_02160 [bacterium]|nr:hypothetical protein [bacterium]